MSNATEYRPTWIERVITAACGEPYGDGYTITDVVTGYAEPGHGTDTDVVVFGDWNSKRYPRDDEPALTREENLGPRLYNALEWLGAKCEWLDEWTRCGECYRAMRTQPNSYSWTMYGTYDEESCDYVCADCMMADPASYLEPYYNNPRNAVVWLEPHEMIRLGWEQWETHNPREYETGWHPGQTDDPEEVLAEIKRETDRDVVFLIDSVGQFDMRWSAWLEPKEGEEDEDDN